MFHRPRQEAIQQAGMANLPCAAGLCSYFRSCVIFPVPLFCWKAEGEVSLSLSACLTGLGCVLPRGPGSGEGAVAHKGSPPLLSGVELGGWSRGVWLLAPWACWRRVVGWAVLEGGGPSATWAQMSRGVL